MSKSKDDLTKTTEEGKIELKEEDLNRIVGGQKSKDGHTHKLVDISLPDSTE